MEENKEVVQKPQGVLLKAKNVLRILSVLCTIFVFCPSFLVSCGGNEMSISAMTPVLGISSSYGGEIVEPKPILLLCLIIPIMILVLLGIKKCTDNKSGIIIMASVVIDLIIWIGFRAEAIKIAEENLCECKTTVWYVLNIIALMLTGAISALVVFKRVKMEENLYEVLFGDGQGKALDQVVASVNQLTGAVGTMAGNVLSELNKPSENVIGYCQKCGAPIVLDTKFCTKCGNEVPESLILEAEEKIRAKKEEAEAESMVTEELENTCKKCGAKLGEGDLFCVQCGEKVE